MTHILRSHVMNNAICSAWYAIDEMRYTKYCIIKAKFQTEQP